MPISHQHKAIFVHVPRTAGSPIEHVLGEHLLWEADIAWVVRGNADPKAWIDRYRGRIPLVHVKDIAPDVLRHRIMLNYEGQAESITQDKIIKELLTKVPVS